MGWVQSIGGEVKEEEGVRRDEGRNSEDGSYILRGAGGSSQVLALQTINTSIGICSHLHHSTGSNLLMNITRPWLQREDYNARIRLNSHKEISRLRTS